MGAFVRYLKNKPFYGQMLTMIAICLWAAQGLGAEWRVGISQADITGPSLGLNFMGYGKLEQKGSGIHTRLFARAFEIESIEDHKRVVLVVCDLLSVSAAVKAAVLERLQAQGRNQYHDDTVLLTATHTHSAPGGFYQEEFYDITTLGFNPTNFEVIVSGIVTAINGAHEDLEPATIESASAELKGITTNRSLPAYNLNPEAPLYSNSVNTRVVQLNFRRTDNSLKGLLNWFPIHGTSMGNENKLISSDNKGYAAWSTETWAKKIHRLKIVAGFANSDAGDSSPNIQNLEYQKLNDFERTKWTGEKQFQNALELIRADATETHGRLAALHAWIKIPGMKIPSSTGSLLSICQGAYGYSFAAGSVLDGPSKVEGFFEGMRIDSPLHLPLIPKLEIELGHLIGLTGKGLDEPCHFPKPVLFPVGSTTPVKIGDVLPFQIIQLGSIAIVTIPGEITTMAGRRLRETVLDQTATLGIREVIVAAYSNGYSGYITTLEEYQAQRYEGAANIFGPHALEAYQHVYQNLSQNLTNFSKHLSSGTNFDDDKSQDKSPSFSTDLPISPPPQFPISEVPFPLKLYWPAHYNFRYSDQYFGYVLLEPQGNYLVGENVHVVFRAAYNEQPDGFVPYNFEIQKKSFADPGEPMWQTVVYEGDPASYLRWEPRLSGLEAHIHWNTKNADPGVYRVVHFGKSRELDLPTSNINLENQRSPLQPYSGASNDFTISNP